MTQSTFDSSDPSALSEVAAVTLGAVLRFPALRRSAGLGSTAGVQPLGTAGSQAGSSPGCVYPLGVCGCVSPGSAWKISPAFR